MRNKLLFLWCIIFVFCVPLFAQQSNGTGDTRDTKYKFTVDGKYEHTMMLTCQLFEGDEQIQDFEIAVFDKQGECRASTYTGVDPNHKNIAYVLIHGTSARDKGMTVRVVYGDKADPHKYDRLVEGLTLDMINLHAMGSTLQPYPLVVSGGPKFSWQVGNSTLQQGTLETLSASLLQGATRLELKGKWENADLEQLKAALPKTTLNEIFFSSEFAHVNLNGVLSGCGALTGVHFSAVLEGDVSKVLEGINPNCFVYLPVGTTVSPEGWSNVVAESERGYTALTDILLVGSTPQQQCPFDLDQDIQLNGHEARFTPVNFDFANGKRGWNTIVLPFEAEVYADEIKLRGNRMNRVRKNNYWLMEYYGCSGNLIDFVYQDRGLQAHVPYLLTLPGDAFGTDFSLQKSIVTFRSTGNVVKAIPTKIISPDLGTQSIEYLGSYTTRLASPMYLLAEMTTGGNAFVYADQGNLLPFHAYMQMNGLQTPTAKVLFISDDYLPTGIDDVVEDKVSDEEAFDLQGRHVANYRHATRGIYIVNGKKQFKK